MSVEKTFKFNIKSKKSGFTIKILWEDAVSGHGLDVAERELSTAIKHLRDFLALIEYPILNSKPTIGKVEIVTPEQCPGGRTFLLADNSQQYTWRCLVPWEQGTFHNLIHEIAGHGCFYGLLPSNHSHLTKRLDYFNQPFQEGLADLMQRPHPTFRHKKLLKNTHPPKSLQEIIAISWSPHNDENYDWAYLMVLYMKLHTLDTLKNVTHAFLDDDKNKMDKRLETFANTHHHDFQKWLKLVKESSEEETEIRLHWNDSSAHTLGKINPSPAFDTHPPSIQNSWVASDPSHQGHTLGAMHPGIPEPNLNSHSEVLTSLPPTHPSAPPRPFAIDCKLGAMHPGVPEPNLDPHNTGFNPNYHPNTAAPPRPFAIDCKLEGDMPRHTVRPNLDSHSEVLTPLPPTHPSAPPRPFAIDCKLGAMHPGVPEPNLDPHNTGFNPNYHPNTAAPPKNFSKAHRLEFMNPGVIPPDSTGRTYRSISKTNTFQSNPPKPLPNTTEQSTTASTSHPTASPSNEVDTTEKSKHLLKKAKELATFFNLSDERIESAIAQSNDSKNGHSLATVKEQLAKAKAAYTALFNQPDRDGLIEASNQFYSQVNPIRKQAYSKCLSQQAGTSVFVSCVQFVLRRLVEFCPSNDYDDACEAYIDPINYDPLGTSNTVAVPLNRYLYHLEDIRNHFLSIQPKGLHPDKLSSNRFIPTDPFTPQEAISLEDYLYLLVELKKHGKKHGIEKLGILRQIHDDDLELCLLIVDHGGSLEYHALPLMRLLSEYKLNAKDKKRLLTGLKDTFQSLGDDNTLVDLESCVCLLLSKEASPTLSRTSFQTANARPSKTSEATSFQIPDDYQALYELIKRNQGSFEAHIVPLITALQEHPALKEQPSLPFLTLLEGHFTTYGSQKTLPHLEAIIKYAVEITCDGTGAYLRMISNDQHHDRPYGEGSSSSSPHNETAPANEATTAPELPDTDHDSFDKNGIAPNQTNNKGKQVLRFWDFTVPQQPASSSSVHPVMQSETASAESSSTSTPPQSSKPIPNRYRRVYSQLAPLWESRENAHLLKACGFQDAKSITAMILTLDSQEEAVTAFKQNIHELFQDKELEHLYKKCSVELMLKNHLTAFQKLAPLKAKILGSYSSNSVNAKTPRERLFQKRLESEGGFYSKLIEKTKCSSPEALLCATKAVESILKDKNQKTCDAIARGKQSFTEVLSKKYHKYYVEAELQPHAASKTNDPARTVEKAGSGTNSNHQHSPAGKTQVKDPGKQPEDKKHSKHHGFFSLNSTHHNKQPPIPSDRKSSKHHRS